MFCLFQGQRKLLWGVAAEEVREVRGKIRWVVTSQLRGLQQAAASFGCIAPKRTPNHKNTQTVVVGVAIITESPARLLSYSQYLNFRPVWGIKRPENPKIRLTLPVIDHTYTYSNNSGLADLE